MLSASIGVRSSHRSVVGGGGGGLTATFQQSATNGNSLSTYTFAAQPIGAASASRRVVVVVTWRTGGTTQPLSSVTIGGVTASMDCVLGTSGNQMAIVSAVVPTGTTADVVVNCADLPARCGIGVWTLSSGSPTGQTATATSTNVLDLTTTTTVGAVVIAGVASNTAGITFTWSGATERYDEIIESGYHHGGADTVAVGTSTPLSVAASGSVTTNRGMAAVYA